MNKSLRLMAFFLGATLSAASFGSSLKVANTSNKSSVDAEWTSLARAVGQAEDHRDQVIAKLRAVKNLKARLLAALPTHNRALALDVISALEMHDLVNELLVYVSADEDGFVTLTINSLLDQKNQSRVLKTYLENLAPGNITRFSSATVVAMLEPLGRLGVQLSNNEVQTLSNQKSPDVRSATLYYLRMMALSHQKHDQDELVKSFLGSSEFQIRLQAVSTMTEFLRSHDPDFTDLTSQASLVTFCNKERSPVIRDYCRSLAEKPKGQR